MCNTYRKIKLITYSEHNGYFAQEMFPLLIFVFVGYKNLAMIKLRKYFLRGKRSSDCKSHFVQTI